MKKNKIIFIGAGVSNLVAANRLIDYSINDFLILEKGDKLEKRKCISEKIMSCNKCTHGCSTLEGVGGANALHGNKLCYFPASNHITKSFSEKEINSALRFLNETASPFFDLDFHLCQEENSCQKKYNSDVLNEEHFKEMVNKLTSRLKDKIITNCDAISYKPYNRGYLIKTLKNDEYLCNHLVLGTGRSSYKTLKNQFDELGIEYKIQAQDIGIRIEAHKDNFSKDYYYQVDPKFKFSWKGLGEGRTFCAHNQGKVVPVRIGNSFFADGAFGEKFGFSNNIALMVRGEIPLSIDNLENWCYSVNSSKNNQLILGELNLNQDKFDLIYQIINLLPTFPSETHKELLHRLLKELFLGKKKIFKDNLLPNSKLTIYGPAVDRQWVAPVLNDDFSTRKFNNLFILGDAAGLSRGFVQAMFSGAIWADRLFYNSNNSKTKVEWLNLV